ncbi:MAG: metal-binding protein [Cyanobacteria bacterium P01_A01_bin.123]
MPSGRTHDRITLWTLPLVTTLTMRLTVSLWITAVVSAGFLFGGLMFGPDLDIHSVQYKRWGCFRWIWLPYRGSLLHRSTLSHGPIIGTTLRVIYVSIWLGVVVVIVAGCLNAIAQSAITWRDLGLSVSQLLQAHSQEWLGLLIGIELGALSHSVSDWVVSSVKRSRRQRKRK